MSDLGFLKLSRNIHPDTSKDAAKSVFPELPGLRRDVYKLVLQHPGLTANEYAALWGAADSREVGRRLPELVTSGHVRRGEPRECGETGRKATTWFPQEWSRF